MEKYAQPLPNLRLKREREQRGWSQEDVARKIGAPDDKTVRRWESGKVTPSPHYRQMLCTLYGKSAEELGLLPENSWPIWNVPYRRNPFFTGREALLNHLRDELSKHGPTALTQPQAISGLGGIGKTQVAVEYAYRYREKYRYVLWMRATSREVLLSEFVMLARLLQLPEQYEQDPYQVVSAVQHWLTTSQQWLLILDSADDLAVVDALLPYTDTGHILLTTRAHATGLFATGIEVETMDLEEGTLLMLRRAKLLASDAALEQASQQDRARIEAIVEMLGGLPLAIDQAAAYIEEAGCGLQGYLDLYRTRRKQLLQRRSAFPSDHPEPVATTWSLSFQQVEQVNPAAADLLRLCAFLAPDAIPEEILILGSADLGQELERVASDAFLLNEAFEALQKFSLLQRHPETNLFSVHRLVQAVLKEDMNDPTQRFWAERVVRVVNRAFPTVELSTWPMCQRLLPHAQECAALIEQWAINLPEATRLLRRTGRYLYELGQYARAIVLYQSALALSERMPGSQHPETASTLNELAQIYLAQSRYAQAEPLYQRALAISEQVLGPEHPDTASILNNLAGLYRGQGKYDQAESLLQRALSIQEQVLGPAHPDTAATLDNLARVYREMGRYDQAEPLLQRALAIREQMLGPEHPGTASILNNLAGLYREQGKYGQAEPILQRALSIREQVLGPAHPDTAATLDNLAGLYRNQSKYEQAESVYLRALALKEAVFGPDHPSIALTLNNLAGLYQDQGKYEQAEPLYQRALAIYEQKLGPEHPNVATGLEGYATLLRHIGRNEEAAALTERAQAIQTSMRSSS